MTPSLSTPVNNRSLRAAVQAFAQAPDQSRYLDVVRACLQGQVLLDSTGSDRPTVNADGSYSFPVGATLQCVGGTGPDGSPALFAFSSQEQITLLHPEDPDSVQSIVQSGIGVLQLASTERYGWLYIDPAGPTCAISQLDAAFALRGSRNDAVKAALEIADPIERRQAVTDALVENGPLLIAVDTGSVSNFEADGTRVRIRDSNAAFGASLLLAFTSGPEVSARNSADSTATRPAAEIMRDAARSPYAGLTLNPGGPSLSLSPDELHGILQRISHSAVPGGDAVG